MKFLFAFPIDTIKFFAGSSEHDGFLKGACGGVDFQFIVFHAVSVRNLDVSDDRDGSFCLAHGCNVGGCMHIDGHSVDRKSVV